MSDVSEEHVQVDVQGEHDEYKVHFLYCLVFPVKDHGEEEQEAQEMRQTILDQLTDAGLMVELFLSVQKDEVYCKVGASDTRLLLEADAAGYLLDVDPHSLKIVAEGNKDEERGPIYLTTPFDPSQSFQKFNYLSRKWSPMKDAEIEPMLKAKTSLKPFDLIHAPYNFDWEAHAKSTYNVQVYKQYPDGSLFRVADRMKLLKRIMERSIRLHERTRSRGAGLNLDRLAYDKHLLGYFPLNTVASSSDSQELSVDELYARWSSLDSTLTPWKQPLQAIRDYFGEKIALYFAFIGHYTKWLIVPALIGLFLFILQMITLKRRSGHFNFLYPTQVEVIVEEDTNVTAYIATVDTENPAVPFFALFVSLWATLFVEFWKRKQARFAFKWGMVGFESSEEPRVQFVPSHRIPSLVTGKVESYYSERRFVAKISASLMVLFVAIIAVLGVIVGILNLKVALTTTSALPTLIAPHVGLVVNAIAIQVMGVLYRMVAVKLNDWENHRTETQYEDNLIVKTFIFSFVNSYTTLFYFAFVKSGSVIREETQFCAPFYAEDGFRDIFMNDRDNVEISDNCYGALGYSLLIIFASQMIVNNSVELILPFILNTVKRMMNLKVDTKTAIVDDVGEATENMANRIGEAGATVGSTINKGLNKTLAVFSPTASARSVSSSATDDSFAFISKELEKVCTKSPAEDQFFLNSYESTLNDFLELAIQFGYVTLFVAAFPLAPFLAIVNNFLEVRVDAYKLCKLCRRPEMLGAQDIGTWEKVFGFLGLVAVISNAAVVCFSSNSILSDEFLRKVGLGSSPDVARVWMFNIFIVSVLFVKWLIGVFVQDVPEEINIQKKRNDFLVDKCFRRVRDDFSPRESVLRSESSSLHVAPSKVYTVHNSDPAIDVLLIEMAKTVRSIAQSQKMFDFRALFQAADTNNSGKISVQEFTSMLKRFGGKIGLKLTESEIQILVHALDTNGNGYVDYHEFAAFLSASSASKGRDAPQEK